jgi:hypothetical protein
MVSLSKWSLECIRNCGGGMKRSVCPECGEQHRLEDTNTYANVDGCPLKQHDHLNNGGELFFFIENKIYYDKYNYLKKIIKGLTFICLVVSITSSSNLKF